MPNQARKRSGLVITFWVLLGGLIFVALASGIAASAWYRELKEFSDIWGNFASVLGLWFGCIAFALAILTLLLTAKAEKDAARKAEEAAEKAEAAVQEAGDKAAKAIQEAEQRTASAIERLGLQVLETGCDLLGRSVKRIQERVAMAMSAQEQAQWHRLWQESAERCRECVELAGDLLANPHLTKDETESLTQGMTGLGEFASFIERNRLPAAKNGNLPGEHTKKVESLFALLTNVRHRVRRQVYEAPNGNP